MKKIGELAADTRRREGTEVGEQWSEDDPQITQITRINRKGTEDGLKIEDKKIRRADGRGRMSPR